MRFGSYNTKNAFGKTITIYCVHNKLIVKVNRLKMQVGQCFGIHQSVRITGQHHIITTTLAGASHVTRNEMEQRVVKQPYLKCQLDEVKQVIMPPNVCQFVQEKRFYLRRTELAQQTKGEQNNGLPKPKRKRFGCVR